MKAPMGNVWMVGRCAVAAVAALLVVLIPSGCGSGRPAPVYEGFGGPVPAGYYRIRSGDTLSRIAARHGVDVETLIRWNHLGDPDQIHAGRLLRVKPPQRKGRTAGRSVRRTAKQTQRTIARTSRQGKQAGIETRPKATRRGTRAIAGLRWQWPLKGKVARKFRSGDRTRQGIRIAGRPGQKVVAAESGTVVYSNNGLKGYGNLIIVKHNNDYLSAYGFNHRLLVREGDRVQRGQGVAEVGKTSAGAYRLHFEVRKKGTPVDPLKYLP